MGVPQFFSWLSGRYPDIVAVLPEQLVRLTRLCNIDHDSTSLYSQSESMARPSL
jgi:5'-3' exonuclease